MAELNGHIVRNVFPLCVQKFVHIVSISCSIPRRYVAGLFHPTFEGRISCNILPRHAIMVLLPIESELCCCKYFFYGNITSNNQF